jgi:hypothetical protein
VKIGLVGLALLLAGAVDADEAVYLMRGPTLPVAHSVNGYVVEVRQRPGNIADVRVTTSIEPIGSEGTLDDVRVSGQPAVPAGFDLPPILRSGLRSEMPAWEAATEVLEWVSDHLDLVADDRHPQDAASVLTRGGGRCSGLANATAALLMAAGFEARTVSGLLIEGRRAIPHRWVECRLPGAGWVPTDPTLGWWTVTPGHVPFHDAVDRIPSIEIVTPPAGDLRHLPRWNGALVRPNDGAELVCRVRDLRVGQRAVATLERGGNRHRLELGPEGRFANLLPGRWLLVVEIDGRVVETRRLTLEAGAVNSYVVSVPSEMREEVGS